MAELLRQSVGKEELALEDAQVTVCAPFTAINAVMVEGLVELGARVRWATSDRFNKPTTAQHEIAAALCVLKDHPVEPFLPTTFDPSDSLSFWKCLE